MQTYVYYNANVSMFHCRTYTMKYAKLKMKVYFIAVCLQ